MEKNFEREMVSLWDKKLKSSAGEGWCETAARVRAMCASVCVPAVWPEAQEPLVTLTMTTCKRLALFRETVRSLLVCCTDIKRYVAKWIVVDDNSSDSDRAAMVAEFPFIEFVWKTPAQKGHAHSMNLLLKRTHTRFLMHVEDDFLFLHRWPLIEHALAVLATEPACAQTLFCANYAEIPSESAVLAGGVWKRLPGRDWTYAVHEHAKTPQQKAAFTAKWGANSLSSNYWPHFSLRPGIWDLQKLRDNGVFWFSPSATHFEMAFAEKYAAAGLVTAFLPSSTTCLHTGKHTSDRTGVNAYALNGEMQFQSRDKEIGRVFCINLERRADRWLKMKEQLCDSIFPVERFNAVDGQTYVLTLDEKHLFRNNDYRWMRGAVACALSHMNAWRAFLDSGHQWLLVLEDDVNVPDAHAFDAGVKDVIEKTAGQFDLIYLTTSERVPEKIEPGTVTKLVPLQELGRNPFAWTLGGNIAYMITRRGIKALLLWLDIVGMRNCLDTMMLKAGMKNIVKVGIVVPARMFCFSEVANTKNVVDSDIQRDFVPINIR